MVGLDQVSEFFVVVDWIGVVWLIGSSIYLGWTLVAVAMGDVPRDGSAASPLLWRLGVIVLIGILLALVLDDGPVLSPWWLQWVVLVAGPTIAGSFASLLGGSRRRRMREPS